MLAPIISGARTSLVDIQAFLAQKRIALVGASHDPKDMSRMLMKDLAASGYDVVPVNKRGGTIDGHPVATSLTALPAPVDGVIVMVPSSESAAVVKDCVAANIPRVWLHRGAGRGATSPEATRLAREHGLLLIDGECPYMFLGGNIHAAHGTVRRLAGQFPHGGTRPVPLWVRITLVVLQSIVGVSATLAGLSMVTDPSGAGLGMTPALIAGSPLSSFLVPGLFLLLVNGLGQLAGASLVLRKRLRAGLAALLLGLVLCVWILFQLAWVDATSWLQPVIFAVGLAEMGLAFAWTRASAPRVRGPHLATVA
ncbi:MAG: CoA-binding protein [Deltaproteobacteria bacterium]|nr:CoA-binding protein [Deltaproteobacteria bacterium]